MIELSGRRIRDRGFTLIEVVVVVTILGLIATVTAAAFVVIVRTTPSVEARNDDSRALLGLTNYLPLDVSSTPVGNIAIPGIPTACGIADGTSLVSLSWADFATSQVTQVNYRLVDNGGWRVVRFGCTAGASQTVNLTSVLDEGAATPSPIPVSVSPLLGDHDKDGGAVTPDQQVGISLIITTLVGTTQRIDAVSDNIPETLGPISVTSTTTATTLPGSNDTPVATDKAFDGWPSQAVIVNLEATDANGDALTASIDPAALLPGPFWSASFTGLEMTLTPDPAAAPGAYTFGYRATDPIGAFDSALVTVTIVAVGATTTTSTTSTSSTTTTTIPCTVSAAAINRSSVSNGVHEDVANLKQSVTITIGKSGSCGSLVLTFVPDTNSPATLQTLSFSGGTAITIEKSDYAWSDGVHVLSVRNGTTGPELASVTLTVT